MYNGSAAGGRSAALGLLRPTAAPLISGRIKAFGLKFKPLHDTGMGHGSGMSGGLGLNLGREHFRADQELPQESKVTLEFQNKDFCNLRRAI